MSELTVVCFYWLGTRWKEGDLGPTYVNRLYRSVGRNLSTPHRFLCFTNEPEGIECETRPHTSPSWLGCLPRLFQYSEESGLTGQILSLDIDIVIVGSLDDLASYRGDFCVRGKFAPQFKWKIDGDIIGFRAGKHHDVLWRPFVDNPKKMERLTGGRERWWYREVHGVGGENGGVDKWQDLFPNQIVSYKRHVRNLDEVPAGARLVSCHGRPRPHEIKEPWAKEHWI